MAVALFAPPLEAWRVRIAVREELSPVLRALFLSSARKLFHESSGWGRLSVDRYTSPSLSKPAEYENELPGARTSLGAFIML